MSFKSIEYDASDGVATITFNRPDAMNAITPDLLREGKTAVDKAAGDTDVRVVVLTGAGKAFTAGVDLKALGDAKVENGAVGALLDDPARDLIDSLQTIPKPVIAKINGFCFTGGLEIALGCDLLVVANEVKFGDTHVKFGLRPSWGMSARLPRAVGIMRARELSFTARTFTGEEAAEMGLAVKAVPRDQLDEAVRELTEQLKKNSSEALAAYKQLYNHGAGQSLQSALDYEFNTAFTISDSEERLAQFRK